MKVLSNSLLLALILGGSIATATASSFIQSVTASGAGLGTFSPILRGLDNPDLFITFSSVNPITLTFEVASGEGSVTSYDIKEEIINNTASLFKGFHLSITDIEGKPIDKVAFTSFNANDDLPPDFSPSFTLDPPSKLPPAPFEATGPQHLNFTGDADTGGLAAGTKVISFFGLSMTEPPAGDPPYFFMLTQTPVVPEPEIYALMLVGLGLVGFIARCRKQNT